MTSNGMPDRAGFSLTGELVSIKPGKVWRGRDGEDRHPINVALLVGDRVVKVEYRDEASALDALGLTDADEALKGVAVALPVFVRAKGKDWLDVSGLNRRAD